MGHLSGFLGALAMLLACIGMYGVMAYGVTRRTSEIGVRMALGAVPGDVARMVLREALLLAVSGMVIGVPVALWLARFTGSSLFGLQPNDPAILMAAGTSLLIVCALAGWIPAWRAARVDPTTALRYEERPPAISGSPSHRRFSARQGASKLCRISTHTCFGTAASNRLGTGQFELNNCYFICRAHLFQLQHVAVGNRNVYTAELRSSAIPTLPYIHQKSADNCSWCPAAPAWSRRCWRSAR